MDDFNVSSLHESKNEWGSRLLTILTPHIIDGLNSIFSEAHKLCKENNEMDKYLMTFQNFITRIPKWNATIIDTEKNRIIEKSSCGYLEDLVTCVHIIQLKLLSAIRVGQKQKKIDINIPKLEDFIHKIYINVARKIYKNVYLFELNIPPLQTQKNHREIEILVQESILNTVRESIPIEAILHAYMDETIEEHVTEEIKEEVIENPADIKKPNAQIIEEVKETKESKEPVIKKLETDSINEEKEIAFPNLETDTSTKLTFSDVDFARDVNNIENTINAPKNIQRLEEISVERNMQRKIEEMADEDDDNVKLKIFGDELKLDNLDIQNIGFPELKLESNLLLNDIEILT